MAKRSGSRGKKSASSKRKAVMVDSQSVRQLQVYRYPFSLATSNPKVPDGKLTQSMGVRINAADIHTHSESLFILAPFLGVNFWNFNQTSTGTPPNHAVYGATKVVLWPPELLEAYKADGLTSPAMQIDTKDTMGRWRQVSRALKLRCITSDEHNDGYWEAVRIPVSDLRKQFYIYNAAGLDVAGIVPDPNATPPVDPNYKFIGSPTHEFVDQMWNKKNWLINPTYQSGKIKNLGQYEFRLQPQKEEHDMVDIPEHIEFKTTEVAPGGVQATTGHFAGEEIEKDGVDLGHLYKCVTDPQFDCICIRISGKPNETRILAHSVANIEFTPRADSDLQMFLTECVDSSNTLKSKQLEFKREERLPGKFVGGPRNS